MSIAVRTDHLTKRYGRSLAVSGIELEVEAGEIFGLVGPNGAGKTTTLKMLATLLPPSAGDAEIGGHSVRKEPDAVRSVIGYMPDTFGVYDDMRVWEYLDFFGRCYGLSAARRRQMIGDLLELVDLADKRGAYVQDLSRGMQQRLCLAHALVHDPQVLLLDEPASGLDPRARVELRELLRELRALGKTILISSHILPELEELCTSVAIIDKGKVLASGRVDDIAERFRVGGVYRATVLGDDARLARAEQVFAASNDVVSVVRRPGGVIELALRGDENTASTVLATAIKGGVKLSSFAPAASDLEELFLQITELGPGGTRMTALAGVARQGGRIGSSIGRGISRFWSGISAVSIKELRGRMRGRRAFVVLTIYLLLLGIFSFAIYVYLKQQAATTTIGNGNVFAPDFPGGMPFPGGQTLANGTALSAGIGHGIFGGLLALETLLVLVLAPAFTTGAISLEREKQTLDLLITTPLSTLGMVIGKLFSALTYVFLLIIASIPLASLVFVFGAVGPEDLLRAYVFLFALAFGMGAIGLFISALVRRTQTATVITFVMVLVLSIGTAAAHQFWTVAARQTSSSSGLVLTQRSNRAPDALLWLNPFVADLDMVCATAPDSYHDSCVYISGVTGRPYFGSPTNTGGGSEPPIIRFDVPAGAPGVGIDDVKPMILVDGREGVDLRACPPNARCAFPGDEGVTQALSFGFPRDTFWPKSAAAFIVLGLVLTLLAAQLVSPTRRLRLPRLNRRRGGEPPTAPPDDTTFAVEDTPIAVEKVS